MVTTIILSPGRAAEKQQVSTRIEKIKEVLGAKEIKIMHPYERFPNLALIVDKEAQERAKPFCRALFDKDGNITDLLYGVFMIVNQTDLGLESLTKGQIKHFLNEFSQPEAIAVVDGILRIFKTQQQKENPIITKLYNGGYDPSRCKFEDKGYRERIDRASDMLENLVSQMTPQLRSLFDDYLRCRAEAQSYGEKLMFYEGIKLAKAIIDIKN